MYWRAWAPGSLTSARGGGHGPAHVVGDHDDLEAELAHRVRRLFDGFLGGVHGHHGRRSHAVGEGPEHLGIHPVHRARHRAAQILVGIRDVEEPERRIHEREVDAEVVESLVEEPRHHGGGPVQRIAGLPPPRGPMGTALHALGRRHLVPARVLGLLHELVDDGGAAHVAQEVEEDRDGLEPVAIAVDHRVIELRAHRRRLGILRVGHGEPPPAFLGQSSSQVKPPTKVTDSSECQTISAARAGPVG